MGSEMCIRDRSLDASNMCPQTPDFPWGNPLPAGSNGLLPLAKGSVFGMGVNLHNNLVSDVARCDVWPFNLNGWNFDLGEVFFLSFELYTRIFVLTD